MANISKSGDIASTMANAPLPSDVKPVTDKGKAPLPTPSFVLVANPKAYEDRTDKSKSNTRIAYVNMTQGCFEFQASIYLERRVVQREDGRHEEKTIRFSMPKGVSLNASIPVERTDEWKNSVIDGFLAWRKASGGAIVSATAAAGVRSID